MAVAIFWTKRAAKKLDTIVQYLEQEWNEAVARAFVKRVFEFEEILQSFPEVGKLEHKERAIRGFVLIKQVRLFYKISHKGIIILNLFDTRLHPRKKRY